MNKAFYPAIIGIAAMFAFNSCGDNGASGKAILEVTSPEAVPIDGGTAGFRITSDSEWKIITSTDDGWFYLNVYEGSGDAAVTAVVEKNEGIERMSDIAVIAGDRTKVARLIQFGVEILEVTTPAPAPAPAAGGKVTFAITSNMEWAIAEPAETWITSIDPPSGTGDATVTVTLEKNSDTAERTATLTVTGGETTREVAVTQEGTTPEPNEKIEN